MGPRSVHHDIGSLDHWGPGVHFGLNELHGVSLDRRGQVGDPLGGYGLAASVLGHDDARRAGQAGQLDGIGRDIARQTDGGHAAIATYERIRSRKGKPYKADINKMVPVATVVVGILGLLLVTGLYLDITKPLG